MLQCSRYMKTSDATTNWLFMRYRCLLPSCSPVWLHIPSSGLCLGAESPERLPSWCRPSWWTSWLHPPDTPRRAPGTAQRGGGGGRWGQREEETSECNLKCFYKTKYLCLLSFLTEQRGQPTVDRRLWYFVTNMILSTKNEHAWCMSFIKSYKSTLMSHECAYNALQTWCW